MTRSDISPEERERNTKLVVPLIQESAKIEIHNWRSLKYEARLSIRRAALGIAVMGYDLWGGSKFHEKRRKNQKSISSTWATTGKSSYAVCQAVWPHLVGAQQARAVCLKEFYEECFLARGDLGKGLRIPLTLEEQKLRVSFWERMMFITKMQEMENNE